jgi:hypothetical protein
VLGNQLFAIETEVDVITETRATRTDDVLVHEISSGFSDRPADRLFQRSNQGAWLLGFKKITSAMDYLKKQRAVLGKALQRGGSIRTARCG